MSHFFDLPVLVVIAGVIALWLQLSRGRDRAASEARRLCRQHGLQLLDETVGLRGLQLRRGSDGLRHWERCYGFDVSIDGDDREACRLWMSRGQLSGYNLPTVRTRDERGRVPTPPPARDLGGDNVVPLRPRLRDGSDRPH